MAAPEPYRPFGLRATNAVGGAISRVRPLPSLDRDTILAKAQQKTGLSDFGPDSFREGLDALLHSLNGEARLNTIGRIAGRSAVQGRLEDRLQVIDWAKRHPEVAEQRIQRPIFVLGFPRTGTTALYGALGTHPELRTPASWETNFPIPPSTEASVETDPRIEQMRKVYAGLRRIAPEAEKLHHMSEHLPQECIVLHTMEFKSLELVVTYPIPGYFAWLKEHGIASAYAWQHRMLQHMQSGYARKHWLLKSPAHLMWLDQLLEEFPDALVVQTHRDPARVLGSVSSLYLTLDHAVSDHGDARAVGREQFAEWEWGLNHAMRVRDQVPEDRVIDVQFADFVADPMAVLRSINEKFGLTHDAEVEARAQRYLDDNARDKFGLHTYSLEDFGLDRRDVDAAFADYRARFGVPIEE